MTATAFLYMLLGAALVACGVFAAALADRIRGIRLTRASRAADRGEAAEVPRPRPREVRAPAAADTIFVPDKPDKPDKPFRVIEPARKAKAIADGADGGDDVIAALVAAGYKKSIASDATWGCSQAERATDESWTAAALRRCVRGGMS